MASSSPFGKTLIRIGSSLPVGLGGMRPENLVTYRTVAGRSPSSRTPSKPQLTGRHRVEPLAGPAIPGPILAGRQRPSATRLHPTQPVENVDYAGGGWQWIDALHC